MQKKDIIKIVTLTSLLGILLLIGQIHRNYDYAHKIYKVYLNGQELGNIANEEELYDLIDEDQQDIKNTYHVDKVYPPNGFRVEECNTYNQNTTKASSIYNQIKNAEDFTIEGYTVKIKFPEEDQKEIVLYVIDKETFVEALTSVVTAFVEEEKFNAYINNTQEEIKDVGSIIENLYFEETITLKPSYISVNEKIYTDANELTQYLLFGTNTDNENRTKRM